MSVGLQASRASVRWLATPKWSTTTPQVLATPPCTSVRLTRAIAWSSSASLIDRSRYITCSTGASKPVSSIDLTIRKASGSALGWSWVLGPDANNGFLKRAMWASTRERADHSPAGSTVSLCSLEITGANSRARMVGRKGRARSRNSSVANRSSGRRMKIHPDDAVLRAVVPVPSRAATSSSRAS